MLQDCKPQTLSLLTNNSDTIIQQICDLYLLDPTAPSLLFAFGNLKNDFTKNFITNGTRYNVGSPKDGHFQYFSTIKMIFCIFIKLI